MVVATARELGEFAVGRMGSFTAPTMDLAVLAYPTGVPVAGDDLRHTLITVLTVDTTRAVTSMAASDEPHACRSVLARIR
jgi:hypothetical protein